MIAQSSVQYMSDSLPTAHSVHWSERPSLIAPISPHSVHRHRSSASPSSCPARTCSIPCSALPSRVVTNTPPSPIPRSTPTAFPGLSVQRLTEGEFCLRGPNFWTFVFRWSLATHRWVLSLSRLKSHPAICGARREISSPIMT